MEDRETRERADSLKTRRAAGFLRSRLDKRGLAICLSGIDGSGKTTLARELVQALEAANVPVRHLHLYQWHVNVLVTPIRLFYNRYFGRKLLVFDRSIYDNFAVASIRRRCPRWFSLAALAVVLACYPKFDYRFYLVVGFKETRLRRPDMDNERFVLLSKTYDEITFRARYTRLRSDTSLFAAVLQRMTAEA
jgi:hypothetical protein